MKKKKKSAALIICSVISSFWVSTNLYKESDFIERSALVLSTVPVMEKSKYLSVLTSQLRVSLTIHIYVWRFGASKETWKNNKTQLKTKPILAVKAGSLCWFIVQVIARLW